MALVVGAVLFAKRRGDTDGDRNKSGTMRNRKRDSLTSGSNASDASSAKDDSTMSVTSDLGSRSNIPSANPASQNEQLQKNKRSGYSQQRFDEFD